MRTKRLFLMMWVFILTTNLWCKPIGSIGGVFSISSYQKVVFSKGNLQYKASTKTWRFAENQKDIIGDKNRNANSTYCGWIDLFPWGGSGHNGKLPFDYSGKNVICLKNIAKTRYDWGINNPIINGGNKKNMWRLMSIYEWEYLLYDRDDADLLRSQAVIDNVLGYVLLPDDWVQPKDCKFIPDANSYFVNRYSSYQWEKMEEAGAVFLPAAGFSDKRGILNIQEGGFYWTSTGAYNIKYAIEFSFGATDFYTDWKVTKYTGQSVRLVQEIE